VNSFLISVSFAAKWISKPRDVLPKRPYWLGNAFKFSIVPWTDLRLSKRTAPLEILKQDRSLILLPSFFQKPQSRNIKTWSHFDQRTRPFAIQNTYTWTYNYTHILLKNFQGYLRQTTFWSTILNLHFVYLYLNAFLQDYCTVFLSLDHQQPQCLLLQSSPRRRAS